jgi:hypothetical protein
MDRFNGQPIIDSFAHPERPGRDERDPSTPMIPLLGEPFVYQNV